MQSRLIRLIGVVFLNSATLSVSVPAQLVAWDKRFVSEVICYCGIGF